MKIALVSCTKLKADHPCKAREMYQESTLFKKALKYIEQKDYEGCYILSAKYGFLQLNQVIEPYDLTLNKMTVAERKNWADLVTQQLENLQLQITQVDFYAGAKYREFIIPKLLEKGINFTVPLEGKGIGEQLKFYNLNTK